MAVNLKVTLGTVNYTDFLHVTASKVPFPGITVWETWIDVPVLNYNFIIPNLDPENYYVRYYDSPTNSALGVLVAELIVNALTSDIISERRFYTVGGAGANDPIDGSTVITDPYLINKVVTGTFKEGFRYYKETEEYLFDNTAGTITILNGTQLTTDEKFIVELQFSTGVSNSSSGLGGLYSGTITVTEATRTLLESEKDKRVRLVGTISTQTITLPPLGVLANDNGYYFDNSIGGTAIQVKILTNGADRIRFNGFMAASDQFAEFWVSKGEHLLLRKLDNSFWEVILDYKGIEVGSRQASGYNSQSGWIKEDGSLFDGDEYPRLWWWINTILPNTHFIVDDFVINGLYNHPPANIGQFVKHSTLKKFRVPNTQNVSEKGLKSFLTFGTDTINRPIDYPGGFQQEGILAHSHYSFIRTSQSGNSNPVGLTTTAVSNGETNANLSYRIQGINPIPFALSAYAGKTSSYGDTENRVKNIGVVYMRHI